MKLPYNIIPSFIFGWVIGKHLYHDVIGLTLVFISGIVFAGASYMDGIRDTDSKRLL